MLISINVNCLRKNELSKYETMYESFYKCFSMVALILSSLAPENDSNLFPFLKNENVGIASIPCFIENSLISSTST